jgi:hypothetical protein
LPRTSVLSIVVIARSVLTDIKGTIDQLEPRHADLKPELQTFVDAALARK